MSLSHGPNLPGRLSRTALAVFLGLGLGVGCKKTIDDQPTLAPTGDAVDGSGPTQAVAEPSEAEMIRLHGSITNVDDMLDVIRDVNARLDPESSTDLKAEMQAMLLQFGFGPGFLSNIDLKGLHAFSFAFPQSEEAASPDAAKLSASIAVVDGRKVIESTPPPFRPQPLGDGVWEFKQNQTRVLLREAGKELLLGLDPGDLEQATGLRGLAGDQGRRVRVHAQNVPVDDIDPAELLGLPAGSKLAEGLSRVVQEATGFDLELELGTDRSVELVAGAQAPVHLLGIEPLGQPRAAATALEGRLPGRPVFVTSLSWGDPALIHKMIDNNLDVAQVPGPFQDLVRKAVGSVHAMLDQVANDAVVALYVDDRGKASLLVAADVRDANATTAAMRALNEALATAVEAQRAMAGKSKNAQFQVEHKPDGLPVPGGKADRFTLTVAKDFESDVAKAGIFLDKNKLDVISFARDDTAIIVVGAGGRKLASDISASLGKTRKDSLAQSAGLEGVRKAMGGCQICIAGDPLDYLRLRMLLLQDQDKALAKSVKPKLAELRKIEQLGESSAGLKVERDAASVAFVIPQKTIYAPVDTWTRVRELFRFVDNPAGS
jgi:hypothetical protein